MIAKQKIKKKLKMVELNMQRQKKVRVIPKDIQVHCDNIESFILCSKY